MADKAKAEKLAAARKKLKQFQQKNKEPSHNARSASPSLKSTSPIDSNINHKELLPEIRQPPEAPEYFQNNPENINSNNGIANGKKDDTPLFYFQNNSSNNSENFFDSIPNKESMIDGDSNAGFQINSIPIHQPIDFNEGVGVPQPAAGNEDASLVSPNAAFDLAYLEGQLSFERKTNEELQRKLADSHGHILTLQHEIKRLHDDQDRKVAQEVLQLEDKLKFQLQTIEILVSEKSELQKELLNLQDEIKANSSKCEELTSRLKASRSQVMKLEADLSERSVNNSQHNGILKRLENELQQKESIVQEALKNLGEARNEIRELERRVEVGLRDQEELKRQLHEKDKQCSMAQIKLAQLGGGDAEGNILKDVENLKGELEKAQKDADNAVEEKKKCENELRQYISNLNAQVLQANAKCERAEKDKEELVTRVEELVKHLSDLEKQLQREKANREPEHSELQEESEVVRALRQEVSDIQAQLISKLEKIEALETHLYEAQEKLSEAERWKENIPDMSLLQAAMESDRVAAARAIEQNNALKLKLTELEEYILKVNNSKLELSEELDKYRHMAGEYRLQMEKFKSRQEMRWVDSVTQTNLIRKSNSETQTTVEDIVHIIEPHEPVSIETLLMIEEKLKKTMGRVADLSDEKQRLEHLVLQLQSETETIGEYVTLYQNQRSLLQEKAEEKERQMALIAKEREELRLKLNQINSLLTKFPHNPEVEDTTCKISSLLGEIQSSSIVQERGADTPPTFHPCLLCSGKLINV